jgi:hypothetical protein
MPFTFSHPAIVLPLYYAPKRWISLTGLIIGSLTPDFEYFIRMNVDSFYSHSVAGIFYFDLPIGILLAFLFHQIIRDSLYDNMPGFIKSRVAVFKEFHWNWYFRKNWLVVIISVIIGAASHLFWDSFTHETGIFVRLIPALQGTMSFFGNTLPVFVFMQYFWTVIGGIIIAIVLFRLPADPDVISWFNFKYWLVFTGIAITVFMLRFRHGISIRNYDVIIITIISAGIISLSITPLIVKPRK